MTVKWNSEKLWIAIFAAMISLLVFHVCSNTHSADWKRSKDYLWIFKDSVKKDIDTNFNFSWIKKRDIYNHFIYKGHYLITLWDFKDLYPLGLDNVIINTNVTLDKLDTYYGKGEVLNSKSSPKTAIRFGRTFHNKIKINLDNNSEILKKIETNNYKGFYGVVNEMTFANESDEDYIQFLYPEGRIPTLLLLYKKSPELYMIIIESNDNINYKFDEKILDILNLKK
jgi:hypothetical protein